MATPRKKKSRKTGRPLEDVPLRTLVKRVKDDIREELQEKASLSEAEETDKPNEE
jgi:hypothetical protein